VGFATDARQCSVPDFEKAIALAPEYALPHAELAMAIVMLWRENYGDLTRTEANAIGTRYAERALALDPNLAEASTRSAGQAGNHVLQQPSDHQE
jgi:hypothetical protein